MKSKLLVPLLFLPVIVLSAIMLYYTAMCRLQKVEVVVEGYDPKNFFSGYYMNLQPNWLKTDCSQFADNVCPKEDFADHYNFYINVDHSAKLTEAVNSGVVKLVFSYDKGYRPLIVDLLVDGKSYFDFIKAE